eukprot:2763702-Rhodomonas_salina.2
MRPFALRPSRCAPSHQAPWYSHVGARPCRCEYWTLRRGGICEYRGGHMGVYASTGHAIRGRMQVRDLA